MGVEVCQMCSELLCFLSLLTNTLLVKRMVVVNIFRRFFCLDVATSLMVKRIVVGGVQRVGSSQVLDLYLALRKELRLEEVLLIHCFPRTV